MITVLSSTGPIAVDGDLSDAAWQPATRLDTFYEFSPGDNVAPKVRTVAWVTYDRDALYVGVQADDPHPEQIRAPYVERDQVFGDQDNIAVFVDTRGDHRSALQLRVNPRGVQADAVSNDAMSSEDFSPDFFYDAAARVTSRGWSAEYRIPLRSLRFKAGAAQSWGFFIIRNYPREFRYQLASVRLPRGSNCFVCNAATLEGLSDLPASGGVVAAPYVTAQDVSSAAAPGAPLRGRPADAEVGLDVKWTPSADTALDAALNPDFSQVESDVAQIAVNNRFALFFPEKRPFFLEGVDLLDTPIEAVYTRTLTDPRWGARATGRLGAASYAVLAAEDAGGGLVVLPGPTLSTLAQQDFRSRAGVARLRRELGGSFAGLLATAREIDGGGHNRVFGPDFQWRPSARDSVTGQLLWSDTRTPALPQLAAEWDGRRLRSLALDLDWRRSTAGLDWRLGYADVGGGFRADLGYVPQVGYRRGGGSLGYTFYRERGFLSRVRPFFEVSQASGRGGGILLRRIAPSLDLQGARNLFARLYYSEERVLTAGRLLDRAQGNAFVYFNPSRRFPQLRLTVVVGEDIDFDHVRVGRGAQITVNATLRPTDHVNLEADSVVGWLNVERKSAGRGRLFTAQVQRLKATYNFSPRASLRLIGQYVGTTRDPALHAFPVPRREARLAGSALFGYRINWQTALFLGYGDERELDAAERLRRTGRQFFLKLSYALQR